MDTIIPPKMNTIFMLAYSPISETTYRGVSAAMICHVFVYNGATPAVCVPEVPRIIAGITAAITRKM